MPRPLQAGPGFAPVEKFCRLLWKQGRRLLLAYCRLWVSLTKPQSGALPECAPLTKSWARLAMELAGPLAQSKYFKMGRAELETQQRAILRAGPSVPTQAVAGTLTCLPGAAAAGLGLFFENHCLRVSRIEKMRAGTFGNGH